ncbi:hypothetical protein SODALDRAFT_331030 [Sodiomyces alkalinus F11]|uniref:Uncharacterized protein n=1 Tax=Sodiomyces alkalinus (strain CBS 110278 / VKM F-3762 / F11) TaxID=1314773 RepID=A0A3N2Q3L3_SODAK|nr:hypothetical protein SODALDRAFT_331030 [Sodiomyces alkalinus F11]ROT41307.1 hypothetical protein SODALDRAFT_331030 [Sodiomyces alkalinus F11]
MSEGAPKRPVNRPLIWYQVDEGRSGFLLLLLLVLFFCSLVLGPWSTVHLPETDRRTPSGWLGGLVVGSSLLCQILPCRSAAVIGESWDHWSGRRSVFFRLRRLRICGYQVANAEGYETKSRQQNW